MISANVKEIDRPGRKVLQVVSRKGKPIQDFKCERGARNEIIDYFIANDLKPMSGSPDWLKKGIENKKENYGN